MRAESRDRRCGYVLECRQCGRRFRTAYRNQRYCCGRCENAPKAQALKPLEEAAEVFGAWQDCDDMRFSPIMTARREYRQHLIDECMDVVQAVVSLLDAEGFTQEDVDAAIGRCNARNLERGRL